MDKENQKKLEILLKKIANEYELEICSLKIKTNQNPTIVQITIQKTNEDDISIDDCSRFNSPAADEIEKQSLNVHMS